MDPSLNNIRHSFVDVVKKMDPVDAVILQYIRENRIRQVIEESSDVGSDYQVGIWDISRAISKPPDEVEVSVCHLAEIMLFDEHKFIHEGDDEGENALAGFKYSRTYWMVNARCREFMRACYPSKPE